MEELKFETISLISNIPMKNQSTQNVINFFIVKIETNLYPKKIYDIAEINQLCIKAGSQRRSKMKQCYCCQIFGYSLLACHLSPKYVRCGESYLAANCANKTKGPKCAFFSSPHISNYRVCPKHSAIKKTSTTNSMYL